MEQFIIYTYIVISIIFMLNFFNIVKQIRTGSKKVNALSLLATSSLVLHFSALAFFFYSQKLIVVFATQIYMLACMLYIKFIHKKDKR